MAAIDLRSYNYKPYVFLAPAIALFAVFGIAPFLLLLQTSVLNWDGINPRHEFVGLGNYFEAIFQDPGFWRSFSQAGYITLLALTVQNALALLLAIAVNRPLAGKTLYRTIFFLPPILSEIVVGLIWVWIYDGNFGILNQFLSMVGLGDLSRAWLADPATALTAVSTIHMWKGFGWGFVIFLAGLQTIPEELYEAARVDGAGAWYRFWRITVPLLLPVMILVSILTILGTMQIFAIIIVTTGGGPAGHTAVPVWEIFSSMRSDGRFGYACAQGIVFGMILLIVSLVQMRFQKKAA
jgi:ABC-type sugar transport system permease subunit